MDQLTEKQMARETAFLNFIFKQVSDPLINSKVYFDKFLSREFTIFPVGKGYPIISKKCSSAECYFYVNLE
jgi:hypothetical protein